MQNTSKLIKITFITTILVAVLCSLSRFFLTAFYFDSEAMFYNSNAPITIVYLLVLAFIALILVTNKKSKIENVHCNTIYNTTDIILAVLFAMTLAFSVIDMADENLITKITGFISAIAGVTSVVFFIVSAFTRCKKEIKALHILNIAPAIYLSSELIKEFTIVSASANSYYLFANLFSVLLLAYFVISDGKSRIKDSSDAVVPMFAISSVTFIALLFSYLPDIILTVMGVFEFNTFDLVFIVIKIIYSIRALIIITSAFKDARKA